MKAADTLPSWLADVDGSLIRRLALAKLLELRQAGATDDEIRTRFGPPPSGAPADDAERLAPLSPARMTDASLRERFGLTRAESRVARLLAEGRSNAEIARSLFNSPHTVARHTERVLRKLDLRSRAQVAARMLWR